MLHRVFKDVDQYWTGICIYVLLQGVLNQLSNMQNIAKQNTLAIEIIAITVAMKDIRHWQKCCDCQAHVNSACLRNDLHSKKVDSSRSLGSLTDCFTIWHLNTEGHRQNILLYLVGIKLREC